MSENPSATDAVKARAALRPAWLPFLAPLLVGVATLLSATLVLDRVARDRRRNTNADLEVGLAREAREAGLRLKADGASAALPAIESVFGRAETLAQSAPVPELAYRSLRGELRLLRGECRLELGLPGADADFGEAVRLLEDCRDAVLAPRARLGVGRVWMAKERPGDAAAEYNELLRRYPNYAVAYRFRAEARRALGDLSGAEADRAKALAMDADAEAEPGGGAVLTP
jgi:tetratricopeptide (TPR) repeat protein